MKVKVFETKYVVCHQWDNHNILEIQWLPESENAEEREFFDLTEQILAGRTLHYVISDARQFRFPVTPELQIEYGAYSTNRFIELGCKKLAVILPEEFIANLGIQQLVEEVDGMKLEGAFATKYFPSIDEAEQWILNE